MVVATANVACGARRERRLVGTWTGVALAGGWRVVRLRGVPIAWSAGAAGWAEREEGSVACSMTLLF